MKTEIRMKKWFMPAAASCLIALSAAACSNNQPSVNNAAHNLPMVETQTATPEPTKPPESIVFPTHSAPETETSEIIADLPRNETLYFGGRQQGSVKSWNPYSGNDNNAMAFVSNSSARLTVFETLYMYNPLDGAMHPLLASGPPEWNDGRTELTVRINPDAKWNDGAAVTAEDVAYTYASHLKYETGPGLRFKDYIETIEAADGAVVLKAKLTPDGAAVNPYQLEDYICGQYVVQKNWTRTLEARTSTPDAFKQDKGWDAVSSGPYKRLYDNEQEVVLVRDDDYWGVSLWGKPPAPKYLAHIIYADDASVRQAFINGSIDVNQQFLPDIQNLWLNNGLPVSAWLEEAPYGLCTVMPSAWFNLRNYGLDQVAVRKAIAMAADYDAINRDAMAGQSPTFIQSPRSLMNPTAAERGLYDQNAVKDLQWTGNDVAGAKKLLDDAGVVDTNGDGNREYNGRELKYKAFCPSGWSYWQAAIAIVAEAGEKIGVNIEAEFPPWDTYRTVIADRTQTEYDIFMYAGDGAGPAYPWARARERLGSAAAGIDDNWAGNFGGYLNPRADEIITAIPRETDPARLKELYTEAVEIYLTDVPSFTLMYRPEFFYAVNETVWIGFPKGAVGQSVPPSGCTDGYGIAALYNLKLAPRIPLK
ncbi:MAG: ABC transporter substrate-binding protein [Clostridiales bacterium]|nr:ABC transporter substrate-binding protein [Clostridiales bacterium]